MTCCKVTSVYGRTLRQGMKLVEVTTSIMVCNGLSLTFQPPQNLFNVFYFGFETNNPGLCYTFGAIPAGVNNMWRHYCWLPGQIAAIVTFIVSMVVLTFVIVSSKTEVLNENLILSINLLSSLYGIFISIYQLVITLLLLKQTFWKLENMFLCWLWYVSHLNIIAFHAICFCANVVTYMCKGQTSMALLIAAVAVIYEGILIYFVIIVNSYIDTLETRVYY